MDDFLKTIDYFFDSFDSSTKIQRFIEDEDKIFFSHSDECFYKREKQLKIIANDINVLSLLTCRSKEELIDLKNKLFGIEFNIDCMRIIKDEKLDSITLELDSKDTEANKKMKTLLNKSFNKILDLMYENFDKFASETSAISPHEISKLPDHIYGLVHDSEIESIKYMVTPTKNNDCIMNFIFRDGSYMEISSKEYIDLNSKFRHFFENPHEYNLNYIIFYLINEYEYNYEPYPISYNMLKMLKEIIIPKLSMAFKK